MDLQRGFGNVKHFECEAALDDRTAFTFISRWHKQNGITACRESFASSPSRWSLAGVVDDSRRRRGPSTKSVPDRTP
ncbi:hypothetical protein EVAR_33469_1 [Eumeta japonica]|uniref:Uncharacterized protein n=1 Tax=Eumeta variegata TaxID=151549 RepID=A0A4C1WHY4_EUMVA|nr:hypothetical protein EVAR_33469_1 [Eumeta japonica]